MKKLLLAVLCFVGAHTTLAVQQPKISHACLGTPSQILSKMQNLPVSNNPYFDTCARNCVNKASGPNQYICQNGTYSPGECGQCINSCIGTYGYELQPTGLINFLNEAC